MTIDSRTTSPTSPPTTSAPRPETPRGASRGWFRAIWRWHFYASFLVIPILLVLATTGLIYLFRFQLEPLLHADLMKVSQPADVVAQPYAGQERAVERAFPDATVVSMTEPKDAGRSTVFSLEQPDGSVRDVYVDPYGAEVLGSLNPDTTLSGAAIRLHGDLMVGPAGDYVIELGACWAIVMAFDRLLPVLQGPRRPRTPSGRRCCRCSTAQQARHGRRVRRTRAAVAAGLRPALDRLLGREGAEPGHHAGVVDVERGPGALSNPTSRLDESLPHSHSIEVPWALGGSEVPSSSESGEGVSVANADTAVEVAEREGLRHPMTVALPDGDDGVYSAIGYAFDDPTAERTVHVDRFGGQVVSTYGYDDYPLLAKVVSQGIGLHEGRSLGLVNFWGMALACLAIVFMCVSGPLMWWRRRPSHRQGVPRSVGAPRGRLPIKATPALLVGLVALGVFLPLFAISLVVVLLLDQLVVRRLPVLATWFNRA